MKKVILGTAILLLIASVSYCQESNQPLQRFDKSLPLALTIKSDKQVYKVGEEIIIEAALKNNGSQELWLGGFYKDIDEIGHRSNFRFRVFKDNSKTERQYINIELLKKMFVDFKKQLIKPGEEIAFKVTLNKWYDMSKPGRYTVVCKYTSKGPFEMDEWLPIWEGTITSNTITIEAREKKDTVLKNTYYSRVTSGLDADLFMSITKGDMSGVRQAIDKGANVNARHFGMFSAGFLDEATPLHFAIFEGNKEIATYLINKGANVNLTNQNKMTPLHFAARFGHKDIVKLLLKNRANPTLRDVSDKIPADIAREKGYEDIVELLAPK